MYQPYQYFPGQPMPQQMPFTDTAGQVRMQQQAQHSALAGRTVNNLNEITAQDLPMNGTSALFPLADGSAIYSRSWRGDGSVQTVEYRPVNQEQENEQVDPIAVLQNDISEIKGMLQSLQKPRTTRSKKVNDEPTD